MSCDKQQNYRKTNIFPNTEVACMYTCFYTHKYIQLHILIILKYTLNIPSCFQHTAIFNLDVYILNKCSEALFVCLDKEELAMKLS